MHDACALMSSHVFHRCGRSIIHRKEREGGWRDLFSFSQVWEGGRVPIVKLHDGESRGGAERDGGRQEKRERRGGVEGEKPLFEGRGGRAPIAKTCTSAHPASCSSPVLFSVCVCVCACVCKRTSHLVTEVPRFRIRLGV